MCTELSSIWLGGELCTESSGRCPHSSRHDSTPSHGTSRRSGFSESVLATLRLGTRWQGRGLFESVLATLRLDTHPGSLDFGWVGCKQALGARQLQQALRELAALFQTRTTSWLKQIWYAARSIRGRVVQGVLRNVRALVPRNSSWGASRARMHGERARGSLPSITWFRKPTRAKGRTHPDRNEIFTFGIFGP